MNVLSRCTNQGATPYDFLSQIITSDLYPDNFLSIDQFVNNTLNILETKINRTTCTNDDLKKLENYQKEIMDAFNELFTHNFAKNRLSTSDKLEYQINDFYIKLLFLMNNLKPIFSSYQKEFEKIYFKLPNYISFKGIPYLEEKDDQSDQNDQNILLSILDNSANNSTQVKQPQISFSITDLLRFYDILCKPNKFFSLSPSFILNAIEKFDNFLNGLQKVDDDDDDNKESQPFLVYFRNLDSESDEFKCYHLVLLIKMRLFVTNDQIYDFIAVLIELIIIEQEKPELKLDDKFSYKKTLQEILPTCFDRRSKIIQKVSSDKILDFCFSHDEQNDFILTKEGVFKINKQSDDQIEFNQLNLTKIDFDISEIDEKDTKIAFSNGVLYLLDFKTRTIHNFVVSKDEELIKKEEKIKKKLENAEERSQIYSIKQTKPKKNKCLNKKEKKQKRKAEKYEYEEERLTNKEPVKVNLPDFPVLSIGAFNNCIRIVQRKSCNDEKTTLILTNVDLGVNNRLNYNINEAFESPKESFTQTQIEVEIENKQTKMKEVFFSKNFMLISYDNSSIQKWMIFDDGKVELNDQNISPLINTSNSTFKMDNKSFLYKIESIQNEEKNGISISKMFIPETKYFLNENNGLFLKYSHFLNLSNVINNCSQYIINYELKPDKKDNDDNETIESEQDQLKLKVTRNEFVFLSQSTISSSKQLKNISFLLRNIKDESLKQFFIILLIRTIGIRFFIDFNRKFINSQIDENFIKAYKLFKEFVLDLYSLSSSSSDFNEYKIMLNESMLFALSAGGKFMFMPDSYNELRDVMKQIVSSPCSQLTFKCLSSFIFSLPSSLYFIDQTFCKKLMKFDHEININELFMKGILLVCIECIHAPQQMNTEKIVEFIFPYIHAFFEYIRYILSDENIPILVAEKLFANFFCLDRPSLDLSLFLEKELIETSKIYFERVRKIPGVVESDNEFIRISNNISKQIITHETVIVESNHPYNLDPLPKPTNESENEKEEEKENHKKPKKKEYVEIELKTIDFGTKANVIQIYFDPQSQIYENDIITIYTRNQSYNYHIDFEGFSRSKLNPEQKYICDINLDIINKLQLLYDDKVRIVIKRSINGQPKENKPLWGVKMEVTGYYNERFETWIPNNHLNLYNYFILYLSTVVHKNAYLSTCLSKAEKDFQIIMDNKFIQGIKLEDIKNYEESLKSNSNNQSLKKPSRNISRGISRGISYDTDEESRFDETIKKDFINGIVNASEDSTTSYKRFLDFIYFKTSKRNFLRLNQSTKSILDVERYFAACLFKQLGLISTCLDLYSIVTVTPSQEYKKIEVPNVLLDLWKKNIYPLRNKLLFAYQKSISNSNSDQDSIIYNFKEYSEEIKQKCILLLYSDPILKFQVENKELTNETFELAMKNIFTFVTSKLPLSDINTIIDTQRERLSISTQSLTSILSFVNQNSLFNSSKSVFALSYDLISKRYSCQCLKQHELDDFDKLFGTFSISFIQNVFDHPSLSMILNMKCLFSLTVSHEDNESRLKCSKLIIDLLKSNSNNNKSIYRDRTNFNLVLVLLAIVIKSENEELIEYMVSLLSQENIDFCSKKLILIIIPFMIKIFNNKAKLLNESIIFSLLDNNYKNPFIIKNLFYWISSIFSEMKSSNNQDFILKVLKGIGQSFIGKSCLFIDDSFKPFTHRQVSESMISFIRILFNTQNESLFIVIHDILTKSIKEVKFGEYNDEMMILIGLCASLGSSLSALEPGRYITNGADYNDANLIVSYNELENKIRVLTNSKRKTYELVNTNIVFLKFIDFDLNDQEIENILQLHKNSKFKIFH